VSLTHNSLHSFRLSLSLSPNQGLGAVDLSPLVLLNNYCATTTVLRPDICDQISNATAQLTPAKKQAPWAAVTGGSQPPSQEDHRATNTPNGIHVHVLTAHCALGYADQISRCPCTGSVRAGKDLPHAPWAVTGAGPLIGQRQQYTVCRRLHTYALALRYL
jgi:hypothetical protein